MNRYFLIILCLFPMFGCAHAQTLGVDGYTCFVTDVHDGDTIRCNTRGGAYATKNVRRPPSGANSHAMAHTLQQNVRRPPSRAKSHAMAHTLQQNVRRPPSGASDDLRIRLIGVFAPELNEPGGIEARDYLRSLLPIGTKITLEFDRHLYDRYGRVLAYIQTRVPEEAGSRLEGRASNIVTPPSRRHCRRDAGATINLLLIHSCLVSTSNKYPFKYYPDYFAASLTCKPQVQQ